MSGERGPTTEELRARALVAAREAYVRGAISIAAFAAVLGRALCEQDAAHLDKEKGERLGSPTHAMTNNPQTTRDPGR